MKKSLLIVALLCAGVTPYAQIFEWAFATGASSTDRTKSIAVHSDGSVYIHGEFSGSPDFDPGPDVFALSPIGFGDSYVLKLDASGNLVWVKVFGNPGIDQPQDLTLDSDGNCYSTGAYELTCDFDPGMDVYNLNASTFNDAYIQKLDSDGNFVWAVTTGGSGMCGGETIAIGENGSVVATGWYQGTVDFDPGEGEDLHTAGSNSDFYIQKLDNAGNFEWVAAFEGTDSGNITSLKVDDQGNNYACGYFEGTIDFDPSDIIAEQSAGSGIALFVVKLDADGNLIWARVIDGQFTERAQGLAIAPNGNLVITGNFSGSVDFDPGADTHLLTAANLGGSEIFFLSLDADGLFIWAKAITGGGSDEGLALCTDESGNIFGTGLFEQTSDFNPGEGNFPLQSSSADDIYMVKLSVEGEFIWAFSLGAFSDQSGTSIAAHNGNIYLGGDFGGTQMDFDPSETGQSLFSNNGFIDMYVLKMSDVEVSIHETTATTVQVFPNPLKDRITVLSDSPIKSVFILDRLGAKSPIQGQVIQSEIDLSNLSEGMYLLQIELNDGNQVVIRVVKN